MILEEKVSWTLENYMSLFLLTVTMWFYWIPAGFSSRDTYEMDWDLTYCRL